MSFQSTSLVAVGDAYALEGDLTIRGVSRRTTFTLLFHGTAVFPMDDKTHAAGPCAAYSTVNSCTIPSVKCGGPCPRAWPDVPCGSEHSAT